MSILVEVIKTFASMFMADAFLAVGTLALVGIVAGLVHAGLSPAWCGLILLMGSLFLVVAAVRRKARKG
ncbi:hypothetical protein [Achromobacter aloeverae]